MNQVAMSRMDLNYPEPRFTSATSSLCESGDDFLNAVDGEHLRHGIVIGKRYWAGGYDILPTTSVFGNRPVTFPGPVCTGLASSMRQLHTGYTALLMNEPDYPGQRFNVIVTPDTKVLRTDAGLGKNGSRLGKHQSSSAYRPAAQMNKMPIVRVSIGAGVLAHRRDENTICKRKIPNGKWIK